MCLSVYRLHVLCCSELPLNNVTVGTIFFFHFPFSQCMFMHVDLKIETLSKMCVGVRRKCGRKQLLGYIFKNLIAELTQYV